MRGLSLALRGIILLYIIQSIGYAHELDVHENLTRRAVDLLLQWDPNFLQRTPFFNNSEDMARELVFGSRDEDTLPRYLFHFLPALDDPSTPLAFARCSSITWGFSKTSCKSSIYLLGRINDHTWEDALSGRNTRAGFRHLGYVLHLLQDLTSPAHTRNDAHLEPDVFEKDEQNLKRCGRGDCIPGPQEVLINFQDPQDPKQFFVDLRSFTVRNFFSEDTVKLASDLLQDHNND